MRLTLAGTVGVAPRLAALTVKQAGGVAAARQDRGMRDYTTVMADHPAWTPSLSHDLVRAFPLGGGGYGIARTDGCQVRWCCPVGAADGPVPGVFMLPPSVPPDEPELARALGRSGRSRGSALQACGMRSAPRSSARSSGQGMPSACTARSAKATASR